MIKFPYYRKKHTASEPGDPNPQHAPVIFTDIGKCSPQVCLRLNDPFSIKCHLLSLQRQPQRRLPVKKAYSILILQPLQMAAQGLLADKQTLCRPGDIHLLNGN